MLAWLWQLIYWFGIPCHAAGDALSGKDGAVQEVRLTNGLKVIIVEDHSYPVVASMVWYKVGSRNETVGATGLSHLVEHLLFGEVGSFRKGEIGAAVARAGGQFNGYTSDDFTTFFEILPSSKLELALRIESERMQSATFTEPDVRQEIARIQEELESEGKNYTQTLAHEVRAAAYQQHPYHNPTMGWRTEIENLTYPQARAYYEQYFRPDNATLVIVGDVKAEIAISAVKKYFSESPKGKSSIPAISVVESSQKGERRVVVKYAGRQEVLQVAYHAPAIGDGDAPAMAVLERLLSAAYSGRLKAKLVLPKICSFASAAFEAKKDPGLFTITCNAIPGVGESQVLEALDGAINQLRAQSLADPEVRRAKNLAEFAYVSEQEGPYKAAFNLGYFDALTGWQGAHTWSERLRSVTASDVQRVVKRYLNPDNRVIGWLSASSQAKPPSTKPASGGESSPVKEPPKAPHSRQAMGVSMTGYKSDEQVAVAESVANDAQQSTPTTVAPILSPAPKIGPPKSVLVESQPKRIHQRVLKNGVTVVIFESHLSPVVEVLGAIRAGDVFDPVSKSGVSALTSSCLNYGSTRKSRSQLALLQEDMGLSPQAMLRFDSGRESIMFRTRCLSRDLCNQLSTVAEILATPALQEADVEKAKQEVVASIKHQEDTVPMRVHRAVLRKLLSPSCSYYPDDLIERVNSITSLKQPDVKSFHSQYVVPGAMTVVLAGNITVEQAMSMLESTVGTWPAKPSPARPAVQATNRRTFRTFIPTGASSGVAVCLGQLVQAQRNRQEYGQLLVADCVLSGHPMISRLKQHPQGENASLDWRTRFESLGGAMVWLLSSSVSTDEAPQAVSSIIAEVKKLAKQGLSPTELSEIKRYLVGALPVRTMGTLTAVCDGVLESYLQCGEADCLSRMLSAIVSASTDSVNKIIRTTFKPDQATMVIAGSAKAIKLIREKAFSPQVK